MASREAHNSIGWAAGVIAAATLSRHGAAMPWCALAFITGWLGSTAPDWMELAWWRRGRGRHTWIAHRTWTHWGLAWAALAGYAYLRMHDMPWLTQAFAFAVGGLIHLVADAPNPLGVPWLWGSQRMSLRLWNSGRADVLVIAPTWLGAAVMADGTWNQGFITARASAFLCKTVWPAFVQGLIDGVQWTAAACERLMAA
jgi:membrane-bound metal-dependent hydrolase YbcI (DUF457 family)